MAMITNLNISVTIHSDTQSHHINYWGHEHEEMAHASIDIYLPPIIAKHCGEDQAQSIMKTIMKDIDLYCEKPRPNSVNYELKISQDTWIEIEFDVME